MKKAVFALATLAVAGSVFAKPAPKGNCPSMAPLCFPELGVKAKVTKAPTLTAKAAEMQAAGAK